jgi:transposase
MLATIVEPVLAVLLPVRSQLAVFERLLRQRARADAAARLLMTAPGVGTVVALAYATTIEDPRFKRSSIVLGRGLCRSHAAALPIRRNGPRRGISPAAATPCCGPISERAAPVR